MAHTRKLHYKDIKATADTHVGKKGDIWYDPLTPQLRTYNGDPGGVLIGSSGGGFPTTWNIYNTQPGNSSPTANWDPDYDMFWFYTNGQNNIGLTLYLPQPSDRTDGQIVWIKIQNYNSTGCYLTIDSSDAGTAIENTGTAISIDAPSIGSSLLLGLKFSAIDPAAGSPTWTVISGSYTAHSF